MEWDVRHTWIQELHHTGEENQATRSFPLHTFPLPASTALLHLSPTEVSIPCPWPLLPPSQFPRLHYHLSTCSSPCRSSAPCKSRPIGQSSFLSPSRMLRNRLHAPRCHFPVSFVPGNRPLRHFMAKVPSADIFFAAISPGPYDSLNLPLSRFLLGWIGYSCLSLCPAPSSPWKVQVQLNSLTFSWEERQKRKLS